MLNTVEVYYTAILIKKTLRNSVFFRIRWKCGEILEQKSNRYKKILTLSIL